MYEIVFKNIIGVLLNEALVLRIFGGVFIYMKGCTKCNIYKELSEFPKDKYKKDGHRAECKVCLYTKQIIQSENWARKRRYKEGLNNPTGRPPLTDEQRSAYKIIKAARDKANRQTIEGKFRQKLNDAKSYAKDPEIKKIRSKKWKDNNKNKVNEYRKKYVEKNRTAINRRLYEYRKQKYKNDHLYKTKETLRRRIKTAIKKGQISKNNSSLTLLGAPIDIVIKHIERQFTKGMTWKNHSAKGWHIDHKIPLSSAKTQDDIFTLCHYTNLQPLWAKDNLQKTNKILPFQVVMPI